MSSDTLPEVSPDISETLAALAQIDAIQKALATLQDAIAKFGVETCNTVMRTLAEAPVVPVVPLRR